LQKELTQNLSNYNDSRSGSCQDSSFSEAYLTTVIVSPFSSYFFLVILSIFRLPSRDLYDHFFWQLTVQPA